MSMTDLMLDPEDLGPADEALLDMLQEGRIIAPFAADETGYNTQYIRDRLSRLVEHGHATKVYQGLYELVEDPRDHAGGQAGDVDDRGATPTPEPTAAAPDAAIDVDVDALDLDTQLTDERREVLLEFLKWVADRDQPVKKGDYAGEFWTDDRADRSGFQERSFWEVLAKPAMKQSGAFEKPNARAYRYSGN